MPETTDLQRFVVLSNARSGSNMLVTMLDGHPEVRCFGEVFNPQSSFGYENWIRKSLWRRLGNQYIRNYCTERYLDSLCAPGSQDKVQAVGFKVIYPGQFDRCSNFRYYWRTREFKAIGLTRENSLRRYVSSRIANEEGVWSAKEQRDRKVSVEVDVNDLLHAVARMETVNRLIETLTAEFWGIGVKYEALLLHRERVLKKIFQFLGVNESQAVRVQPTTVKQNPARLDEIIDNYEEVRSALLGTAYERFLEEPSD